MENQPTNGFLEPPAAGIVPPTTGILEEFRIEFLDCWKRLPNKGFFFFLLAAWLALFQFLGNTTFGFVPTPSLLQWMYMVYQPGVNSDDGHGKLIPFVVLGLFWWKRRALLALPMRTWSPALLLVALGLALHIVGYLVQQPRISIVGLFTGIYGLMGLTWGPAFLKGCFFPFFLFAFCVPLGTQAVPITFPLRLLVCRIVEAISHNILAIDVLRQGTALIDPTGHYQYEVAAACSGIRSLIATFALATIYAMIAFQKPWRRLLIVASAVPFAVFGNVLRMLAIVIAAEMGGQSWGNNVHEGGPWGVFNLLYYIPAFVGLFMFGHWLREPDSKPPASPGEKTV